MARDCAVVIAATSEGEARALAGLAIGEVQRIDGKFSRQQPGSVVARINAAAGGAPVACDHETQALLDQVDALHRASGGLFDITSGAPRPPSGWQRVERDARSVRLPLAGMALDFGALCPAYAADCAGDLLTRQGAQHGYVSLGDHTLVIGPQPDDTPWLFDIPDRQQQGELVATLPVLQGGLATRDEPARRAPPKARHLLPARAGRAARWRSISVVAPVAMAAGNCSTIAMLKQEAGLAFLRASRMNYLAVDRDGGIYTNTLVEA